MFFRLESANSVHHFPDDPPVKAVPRANVSVSKNTKFFPQHFWPAADKRFRMRYKPVVMQGNVQTVQTLLQTGLSFPILRTPSGKGISRKYFAPKTKGYA